MNSADEIPEPNNLAWLMRQESVDADRTLAKERGFLFRIMRKEKRGGPWTEISANIDDLEKAMTLAGAVEAYEAGVFVGGSIYWTSRWPDVFNSTVIKLSRSADPSPQP
jgi:hypothetical protein